MRRNKPSSGDRAQGGERKKCPGGPMVRESGEGNHSSGLDIIISQGEISEQSKPEGK